MNVYETLEKIKNKARSNNEFRQKLIETEKTNRPYSNFCKICSEEGFPISPMDLLNAGEESYAAIKRSTNGGGENSPKLNGQDDIYEMFLIELADNKT